MVKSKPTTLAVSARHDPFCTTRRYRANKNLEAKLVNIIVKTSTLAGASFQPALRCCLNSSPRYLSHLGTKRLLKRFCKLGPRFSQSRIPVSSTKSQLVLFNKQQRQSRSFSSA